ncbi:MAG: tetratricopeptide repeat protein [Chitinophagaceae bacterium]
MTQNNLGNALRDQGIRIGDQEGATLITQAVAAYRAALEIYTKEDLPQYWAMAQHNLGLLYKQTKQWELAIQYFESIRRMYPEYIEEKIKEIRTKMKQPAPNYLNKYNPCVVRFDVPYCFIKSIIARKSCVNRFELCPVHPD